LSSADSCLGFRWRMRITRVKLPPKMNRTTRVSPRLAPLQEVMLRDSLAEGTAGHHVEQVEIVFAPDAWRNRVAAAWAETIARTEALRVAFSVENGEPVGIEAVVTRPALCENEALPASWDTWLTADRCRPLIAPGEVPWRAVYWPQSGRFLWTFHHALLDGRSITTVLRGFLARLSGDPAEDLALAKWHAPTPEAVSTAERMFREDFPPLAMDVWFPEDADHGPALRFLGEDFRKRLDVVALAVESTTATLLIWAWGQALAIASGSDAVIVEQVRAGAPQRGTAGFTMLTLPVLVPRAVDADVEKPLRDFRRHLLALRSIEGVSPADFPPGVFPDVDRLGSSVIMVEHATPAYLLTTEMVESVKLHECKGETLMATAHLMPDLRLEVEGPGRHGLLDGWLRALENLAGSRIFS
jgi:hypothetical protein